jgi:hypothetical protein
VRSTENAKPASEARWSPIVELRRYTLRPGQRDVLIDLFDSTLVAPQERAGMKIIGQFLDLDDPDAFVWLRGFHDMAVRAQSLATFYGGPAWRAHSQAANATMVDSDDVLLLRPVHPSSAFELDRRPAGSSERERGFVVATILQLEAPPEESGTLSFFEHEIVPTVIEAGGKVLAYFGTEASPNTFPALPVREGELVFVWFTGVPDRATLERVSGKATEAGRTAAQAPGLKQPPQVLRLAPTSSSALAG